jgi:hypothetical protein
MHLDDLAIDQLESGVLSETPAAAMRWNSSTVKRLVVTSVTTMQIFARTLLAADASERAGR